MTQKAALCRALLAGETISIMDGFKKFGITNCPREIGRGIEREFDVRVFRQPKTAKTRYGTTCSYFLYSLPRNQQNKEGIERMKKYVAQQLKK